MSIKGPIEKHYHRYLYCIIAIHVNRASMEAGASLRLLQNPFSALSKNYMFYLRNFYLVLLVIVIARHGTALPVINWRSPGVFEDDRSPSEILQYHAVPRELGYMIDDFPIAVPHCSALKGPWGLVTFVVVISWPILSDTRYLCNTLRGDLEHVRHIIAWIVTKNNNNRSLGAHTCAES